MSRDYAARRRFDKRAYGARLTKREETYRLEDLKGLVARSIRDREGTRCFGGEMKMRCLEPGHEDKNPSAAWNASKGCGLCYSCGATWSTVDAARLLNLI